MSSHDDPSGLIDGPARAQDVHFCSDGHRLRGVLVTPAGSRVPGHGAPGHGAPGHGAPGHGAPDHGAPDHGDGPWPGLVCSHGWSGAVNFRALPLAGRLALAGYATLVLDHRGFGGSEGPRARCDPREQARDVSHAATYLASRPDIDGGALGVIGASFGGAIAVAAAAADERLAACVAIVPVASGRRWLAGLHGERGWAALAERLAADETARVLTGAGERTGLGALMPMPPGPAGEAEAALIARAYPGGYPVENAALAAAFAPEDEVARIAPRALCLIAAADDTMVPAAESRAMFGRAGEPKELHVLPEGGHGGPLGPHVDATAELAAAFLGRHLRAGAAR